MEIAIVENDVHFLMGEFYLQEEGFRGRPLDQVNHLSVEKLDVGCKDDIEVDDMLILLDVVSADRIYHLSKAGS
jgi:hypothetical protein